MFQQKITPFEKFVAKYVFFNFLKFQFGTFIKKQTHKDFTYLDPPNFA